MSKLVLESSSELPRFHRLAQDIDSLWSQFNVENDSLLNACIDLDVVPEFDVDCEPFVRDIVASIRLVVDQNKDKTVVVSNIDKLVVAGASAHRSNELRSDNHCPLTPPTSSLTSQGSVPLSANIRSMRLPKIPLPSFDSTIHKWPAFRDSFKFIALRNSKLWYEDHLVLLSLF